MNIRVGMNLLWCVPGAVGGSEEYFVRQLLGLTEHRHEFDVTAYVLPGFADAHPDVADRYELATAPIDGRSRPRRVVAESTWLASAQRARGDRLAHHGGGTMPRRGVRPAVLTIHDLQYLAFPQYFSGVKLRYLRARMPSSTRRAAVITVPTEFVKGTVVEHLGVPEERVVVVNNGVEPTVGRSPTPPEDLRRRLGLGTDTRVLVYTAATFPHKRHDFLVELMQTVWRDDADLRLVMVGGVGLAEQALQRRLAELDDTRIVRAGRVSAADRDGLVCMAEAVVFPSEYEGFGAPLIEAMALGTPVIASSSTAIPEVLGRAGYTLPLEPAAWRNALGELTGRRADLIAAGRLRAEQFTSANTARALLDAYRLALS